MKKVSIVDKKGVVVIMEPADSGELELDETDSVRFEIDGLFFDVRIDRRLKLLMIQKHNAPGETVTPILIQPIDNTTLLLT